MDTYSQEEKHEKKRERDRIFRYSLRMYESLGPQALKDKIATLKFKLILDSVLSEDDFWDLYYDLVENNEGWTDSHVLAYFDTELLE